VVDRLCASGLRAAVVNSMADLFADPQLRARGAWLEVNHPVLGRVHVAAPPYWLCDTPPAAQRAAPLLGADTAAVLAEVLGLDDHEIETLEQAGVLR
jgi:crotonobetainyl-CoA:carnitine CoA-transferase CaiB-like acyl-CoA transferase